MRTIFSFAVALLLPHGVVQAQVQPSSNLIVDIRYTDGDNIVYEGESGVIEVFLLNNAVAPDGGVRVRAILTGENGFNANDFSLTPGDGFVSTTANSIRGFVTIPAGSNSARVGPVIKLDSATESGESILIQIDMPTNGAVLNVMPVPTIVVGLRVLVYDTYIAAFTTSDSIADEGDIVNLEVSVSGGFEGAIITSMNISGVTADDYSVLPATGVIIGSSGLSVVLPSSVRSVRIPIEIRNDTIPEGDEIMVVAFGRFIGNPPIGGRLIVSPDLSQSSNRITIARNGNLIASLQPPSMATVREEQETTIDITYSHPPDNLPSYLHFRVSGTATVGSDYEVQTGVGGGFTAHNGYGYVRTNVSEIIINVLADDFTEDAETIVVSPVNHNYNTHVAENSIPPASPILSIDPNNTQTITISPNAPVVVAVAAAASSYLEGESAVFNFTLTTAAGRLRNRDLTVRYDIFGDVTVGDYSDANGGSITIPKPVDPANPTAAETAPFPLSILLNVDSATDSGLEFEETLTLRIAEVSGGGDGGAAINNSRRSASTTIAPSTAIVHIGGTRACLLQESPGADCPATFSAQSNEGKAWSIPISVSGVNYSGSSVAVWYFLSGTAGTADYKDVDDGVVSVKAPGTTTVSIPLSSDGIPENDENLTLTIDRARFLKSDPSLPPVAIHPTYKTAATTISDVPSIVSVSAHDCPLGSDGITRSCGTAVKSTAAEGEDVFFVFSYVDENGVSVAPRANVTINYTISGNVTATDYIDSNSGSITLRADATRNNRRVRITIANDNLAESAEILIFTITSVSGGAQNISSTADSARVNIPANDGVLVYPRFVGVTEVDETARTVNYQICTLGLDWTSTRPGDRDLFLVSWAFSGSAVGDTVSSPVTNADYRRVAVASTTIYGEGAHTCHDKDLSDDGFFRFTINNDNRNEGAETVVITITGAGFFVDRGDDNPVQRSTEPATLTINASDPLTVSVTESNAATVAEGGSLNYVVGYGTTTVPSAALTVNYTVSGVTVDDITATSLDGSITIPAGGANEAGRTVTITIADDSETENAEDITVAFTGYSGGDGSGVINFTAADFTHTIPANDGIRASVTAGDDVAEGEQAIFTFTVIGEVGTGTYTVTYITGGTFEGAATDDASLMTMIDCARDTVNGLCSIDLSINIPADNVIETDETLTVTLSSLSGTNASVDTTVASLTVTDATALAVSVVAPTVNVSEGANAEFPLSFNLDPGLTIAADVTVTYDFSGDAVTDGSGSVTVAAGESASLITILVPDDNDNEASSNLSVTLDTVTGANIGDDSATAIVAASDPVIVTLSGGGDVAEGGTATVDVALSGGNLTGDLELTYEVSGDAATDTAGGGMLTITTADTAPYSFSIATTDDNINEAANTFTVSATATTVGNADVVNSPQTFTITDNDPITVTVTGGGGVAEGGSATFTVTLSGGAHDSEVTVPWTLGATDATDDDDAESVDYSTAAQTPLRFAVGDSSDSVTVNITDDGVAEVEEKFAFTVGSVSTVGAHTVVGSPQVATIAASVNTVRTVAITGPTTVSEGDATTNYSVAVSGHRPTADISVTWSVTAGDTVAADFDGGLPAGAVLTFTPDNYLTAQTFTVSTAEDTLLEGGETFTVAIAVATASTGTTNGDGDTHDTAITDDDTATVTVARSDTDGFTEGGIGTVGTAVFTVTVADATLTTAADIAFTVTGADGADDYTVAPTSPLSLTGTTGTITVTAVDDNINEASETVTVTLTAADTSGTINIGSTADATADITDDDAIAVTVATTATTVDEGDSVTFTVTLSKASDAVVVVPYTVSGVSVGDVALTSLTGTVSVAVGQTEGALTFDITRDASMESAETLTLALDASGYTPAGRGIARGAPASAMLTINASAATVRRLTISGPSTISETDAAVESGTYTVAIAEGDAFTAETAVTWTVSGVDDADFVAASDRSGSVTFAAGSKTSQTFTVTVAGDNLNEGDESFTVALGVADATTDGGTAFGDAFETTITDDDTATVTVERTDTDAFEEGGVGALGTAVFTVTVADATLTGAADIVFTVTGGTVTDDYTFAPAGGMLSITGTTGTITVTAVDDNLNEASETVTVTLTGASTTGAINIGDDKSDTANLSDNDAITYRISGGGDVNESDGAVASFTVHLSGTSAAEVTVPIEVSGTAESSDYTAPATVAVAASSVVQNFTIAIVNDTVNEAAETVIATVGATPTVATGGGSVTRTTTVAQQSATATIGASDPITYAIGADMEVAESATTVNIAVTLSGAAGGSEGGAVSVPFTVDTTSTATDLADYTVTASPLTFANGNGSMNIAVTVKADTLSEQNETVILNLGTPTGGAGVGGFIAGADISATVTITDDDTASVTVARTDTDGFTEGGAGAAGTAVFTVTIAGATLTAAASVTFSVTGADDASDYTFSPTSPLSIAAGTVSDTITVTAVDNNINEASETVTVTITGVTPTDMINIGSDSSDTADIVDDDAITVTVAGGGNVSEGGSVTFTVTLSGGTHNSEVAVPWTLGATVATDDDDAEAVDYSTAAQTPLRFAVGDTSGDIIVNITDDGVEEVAEKFAFTIGSVAAAGTVNVSGSPQVVTIAASVNTARTVAITGPTTVAEGDTTTDYSVSITGHKPTADIGVTWSVTAGDTEAGDFSGGTLPAGAVLTFTPDNYLTAQTFTIATAEDTLLEGGETFTVAIAVATSSTGTTNGDGDTHDTDITDDDTATVTVARSDTDAFTEGGATTAGTAVFTVTVADATLTAAADITFTVTGADGASDYTFSPASPLSITGTTGTITVTAVDDNINEASETVTVALTTADTTGTIAIDTDNDDATADITDDDAIAVTVATTATTVDEGDSVTFTVTLSKASDAVVVVPYTVSGVSVGDVSLTSLTGVLSVAAGQTEGALMFDITRDALLESAETLTLGLDASGYTPAGRGIARGSPASAMLTINASVATVRRLTISGPSTISETDAAVESGTYTVAIAEGDAFTAETAVTWTVSGVEDADFVAASDRSGSVTFAAGSTTSQTFTVTVAGDNLNEGDESFTIALSVADATTDGGTAFGDAFETTITDDDTITATLSGGGDVVEGDDAEVTVTLSGEMLTAAVVLEYSVTGALTASGVFTIATTDSAPHSFLLSTAENTLNEADKMFTVNATATSAGTVTVAAAQTFTITDDDDITYRISGGGDVNESDGAVASFTVHLSGTSAAEVTVPIEVSGTAESSDYTAPATVSVAAGSVMQNFTIAIVNDTVNEAAETVVITVGATPTVATGGGAVTRTTTVAQQSATATIGASDPITYAIGADMEVAESATTVNIAVTLSGAAGGSEGGAVNVPFTVDTASTAADPADYTVTASPLTFANGNGSVNIAVTVVADTLSEQNETVILNLGTPTGGAGVGNFIAGAEISATVTITDDDTASVTVARTDTDGFTEGGAGAAGTAVFTVTIAGATLTVAASVTFSVTGADDASDYTFSPASPLSIAAGTVSDTITVTAVDNNINEASETVTVTITGVTPTDMINIGSDSSDTADIVDDDAITVTVAGGGNVSEGGSVTFTVTLSGGVHGSEVTVPWTLGATVATDDDDAEAADYSTAAQTPLRFAVGDTSGDIIVNITDDGVEEVAEKFAFTIGSVAAAGTVNVSGSPQVVTIAASVNTVRTVAITGPTTVAEGDTTTDYSVSITGHKPTADIGVTWSVTAGDTEAGDFSGGVLPAGAALTFTPDNYLTAQTFTIATAEDTLLEASETFTVAIAVATSSTGTTNGDGDTHDTAITDDDTATVTVARSDTDAFTEGGATTAGTAVFTVTVADATLTAAADITFTVTGADGASDYAFSPASPLSITGTTGTITVTAVDDNINEASETVTVTITTADTTGTIAIDTDNDDATADITDDDAIAVTVATTATTVDEGDSVTFTVTLSKASDAVVVVPYTVSGVSVGDVSLTSLTGVLSVAAGQTEGALMFDITRDALLESAETLTLGLDASGYTPAGRGIARGSPASAMLTINASVATVRRLTISGPSTISETDAAVESGTYTVAIAEGDAFTAETAVTWTVSGVEDADFVAASDRSGSVTFAAGSTTSQTFTVTVAGDNLNEGDESFTIALSVADATIDGGTAFGNAHTTVISDDDTITATLSGGGDVVEGNDAEVTVTLGGATLTAAVVLDYSVTGALTDSGTFTIATTDSAPHSFSINTVDNTLNEADRMFTVNASAMSAGTVTVAAAQTFTIIDNDPITVSIARAAATVNEGDIAGFTVTLSGASAGNISVDYTAVGTTDTPTDANGGSVTIAAGATEGTIALGIPFSAALNANAADETLRVTLDRVRVGSGGGAVTVAVAPDNSASVTVNYLDSAHVITFDSPTTTIAEGTAATYTVSRSGPAIPLGSSITVRWTYTAGTAAPVAADFAGDTAPTGGTLTFIGRETAETFVITTAEDTLSEGSENFTLNLRADDSVLNSNGGVTLSAGIGVTITDNDDISVSIDGPPSVSERREVRYRVRLSAAPTVELRLDWAVGAGVVSGDMIAARVDDFDGGVFPAGTLVFPVGVTQRAIVFSTTDGGGIGTARRAFAITIRNIIGGGGRNAPAPSVLNVTLTEDDAATRAEQMRSVSALLGRAAAVLTATVVRERLLRRPTRRTLNVAGRPVAVVDAAVLASGTGPWAADPFLRASVAAADATGAAVTVSDLVHSTAFALPLFGREWATGDASLWGAGGGISSSGKIGQLRYDEDAIAFHIGADREWGDGFVAGLSVARTVGEVDAKQTINGIEIKNRTESQMVSVHPYVLRRLGEHSHGWLVLGLGRSSVDVQETQSNVVRRASSDLTTTMAAFGAAWRRPVFMFDLTVHADGVLTRNELQSATFDDGSLLPKVTSDTMQINLETEAGHTWECACGIMRIYATAALRDEFGDAKPDGGTAADVGGRLEWDGANGFLLRMRAAKQLAGDGDATQWSAEVDWNRAYRGLHRGFAFVPYAQLTPDTWRTGLRLSGGRVTVRFGVDVDEDGIDYRHLLRGDVTF